MHTSQRYIANGSAVFAPSSNATVGDVARDQHVELLVDTFEIAQDQRAHPLGLSVVRVVVTRRQRVRAEHDPALHLGSETRFARVGVHVRDVFARRPVVRNARRRNAPGSTTLPPARSGSTRRCRRSADGTETVSTFAPAASSADGRGAHRGAHARFDAVDLRHLVDDADAQARHAFFEPGEQCRRRAARSTWSRTGSWPPITSSSNAASSTVAANGPIWSSDEANAMSP